MKRWLLGGASLVALGFGVGANAADLMPIKAPMLAAPPVSEWEIDAGMRFWFSRGSIGAPNPLLNNPGNILASRLLYKDEDAFSGELYSRLDHSSGWFVKAEAGLGRITAGNMFDEDFPVGGAYSNTLQNNNSGNLQYGNVDVGYTFLKSPGSKLGAFVGYGYYGQHVNTFGCVQLAGSTACAPGTFPAGFLGISEDNAFQSFRVGLSSQFMLTDRLKLTADVAWVPVANFQGIDNHNARSLLINEASSNGDGVMLEAFLSYAVTNAINIGVGGRYWAWNMRDGSATFNPLAGPVLNEPARYNTERYGVFTQASYHWGDVTPPVVSAGMYSKAPELPTTWNGFYIGAHVGGGWGNDHWSDPFGATAGTGGTVNVPGFGDSTHASGPLGGGQAGVDWQVGQAVYGLQADISGADLRGENTCFSGLGGLNCQHIVNAIGTFTARLGLAWGRSLYYVKGGGAWTNTTYNLNGNTNALALGTASSNVNAGGWTVGGGVEYAFDRRWSAMLEYDHIGIGGTTVGFPTVAVVSAQAISIRQDIDMIKLGMNFKLN